MNKSLSKRKFALDGFEHVKTWVTSHANEQRRGAIMAETYFQKSLISSINISTLKRWKHVWTGIRKQILRNVGQHRPCLSLCITVLQTNINWFVLGFDRYGHTDTDMVIPIYSKPTTIPILPSRIHIWFHVFRYHYLLSVSVISV